MENPMGTTQHARRTPRFLLAVVMLAAGLAAGLGAMAVASGGEIYHACVNNSSGTIKMISESGTCAQNELRIVWNQQGPQGPAGAKGDQGEVGPQGPQGEAGPAGEAADIEFLLAQIDQIQGQIETLNTVVEELANIPTISIDDVTAMEGNSGITEFVFTVSLSRSYSQLITVEFATQPGTATATDFNSKSGTLHFAAGETTATITIEVLGNVFAELDETFYVNLSNASHGLLTRAQGIGTILNDDLPILRISSPVTCIYGNPCNVEVAYGGVFAEPVSVQYSTRDGSAIAGTHYHAAQGILTLAPGQNRATITIGTIAPGTFQNWSDTHFFVEMSNPTNAIFGSFSPVSNVQLRMQ
jgi:hypothetical protein